ncbi:hypothetical protein [Pseudomonas sp. SJZ131]|uniref:hypothetical protein n=1 Tax=Pseudomonas sp. SJZ131 TaxID=2572895 RepID=UPI0011A2A28F|nr:hypothetical protein [Pseudomonas sp. SJZ131]
MDSFFMRAAFASLQVIDVVRGKAAEKRQPAETGCRFSGIAALPLPANPRFTGFFELARCLLWSS